MQDLKIGSWQPAAGVTNQTTAQENSTGFKETIKGAIDKVNKLDKAADQSIMDLLAGKADIHESMIALQKLDLSMRMLLTVKNKALEAYKEIIHMQF